MILSGFHLYNWYYTWAWLGQLAGVTKRWAIIRQIRSEDKEYIQTANHGWADDIWDLWLYLLNKWRVTILSLNSWYWDNLRMRFQWVMSLLGTQITCGLDQSELMFPHAVVVSKPVILDIVIHKFDTLAGIGLPCKTGCPGSLIYVSFVRKKI